MHRTILVVVWIALAVLAWGTQGVLLDAGQRSLGGVLRPWIGLGLAYLAIAVAIPAGVLLVRGERGHWSWRGVLWSFAAGVIGAAGAWFILAAFAVRGAPIAVMPLVFGAAPVIYALALIVLQRQFDEVGWPLLAGVTLVVLGFAGALINQPTASRVSVQVDDQGRVIVTETQVGESGEQSQSWTADSAEQLRESSAHAFHLYQRWRRVGFGQWVRMVACIVLAGFCWGAYGPLLHRGQVRMGGSDMRPLLCLGAAYFTAAVVIPWALLSSGVSVEAGSWNAVGLMWTLLGGAASAAGAFALILAFNSGGRPNVVMPLVFGGAPLINTLACWLAESAMDPLRAGFWVSLALLVVGAVIVLVFAPRPERSAPHSPPADSISQKASPEDASAAASE